MSELPSPRTDFEEISLKSGDDRIKVVLSSFARRLESELGELEGIANTLADRIDWAVKVFESQGDFSKLPWDCADEWTIYAKSALVELKAFKEKKKVNCRARGVLPDQETDSQEKHGDA